MNLCNIVKKTIALTAILTLHYTAFGMEEMAVEIEPIEQQAQKTITISIEDKEYVLTREQAFKCITLKNMLGDLEDTDDAIPLPISSAAFDYIHKDLTAALYQAEIINDATLVEMLNGGNYLDCEDLKTKYSTLFMQRTTQNLTKENLADRLTWINNLITTEELAQLLMQTLLKHPLLQEFITTPIIYGQLPQGTKYRFSPDSLKIATCSFENFSMHDAYNGKLLWEHNEQYDGMLFSFGQTIVALADSNEKPIRIVLYDTEIGSLLWKLEEEISHIKAIDQVVYSQNNKYIAVVGNHKDEDRNVLFMINAASGSILWQKEFNHLFDINFSPSGNELLVYIQATENKNALFEAYAPKDGALLDAREGVIMHVISPDNKSFIEFQKNTVSLYSDYYKTLLWQIHVNEPIDAALFSPDSSKICVLLRDNTLSMYTVKTGTLCWSNKEYESTVGACDITFSSNEKKIIVHWDNGPELNNLNEIKIYSLEDGTLLKTHNNPGTLSSDNLFHYAIDRSNESYVIQDIQSGESIFQHSYTDTEVPGHCIFSPDNNTVLITDHSETNNSYIIRLKDTLLPQKLRHLTLDEILVFFYAVQTITDHKPLQFIDENVRNIYANLDEMIKFNIRHYIRQQVYE